MRPPQSCVLFYLVLNPQSVSGVDRASCGSDTGQRERIVRMGDRKVKIDCGTITLHTLIKKLRPDKNLCKKIDK